MNGVSRTGVVKGRDTARCVIPFCGHKNVRSTHRTTIEITRDESLSVRGDCIVGVSGTMGCLDLPDDIKAGLRNNSSVVRVRIMVNGDVFVVSGRGSSDLTLTHSHDIVLRKSGFVCPRTLAVRCDAASSDMPRRMVRNLQDGASGTMEITIRPR